VHHSDQLCLDLDPNPDHRLKIIFPILNLTFLRASAMLKHVIAIGWTSVRLSVRLSVTRWYCIKTAEHFVMLSSPHDSPFILVSCISRSSRNSDGVTPCGPLNRGGV